MHNDERHGGGQAPQLKKAIAVFDFQLVGTRQVQNHQVHASAGKPSQRRSNASHQLDTSPIASIRECLPNWLTIRRVFLNQKDQCTLAHVSTPKVNRHALQPHRLCFCETVLRRIETGGSSSWLSSPLGRLTLGLNGS